MERIDTQWSSILVGHEERGQVRSLWRGLQTLAARLRQSDNGPRLGSMSDAWLAEHVAESDKHNVT